MTATLPVLDADPCWQRIGVWGDRSCPELVVLTHCHNCPVFAAAGRRFLDAPPPDGYRDEWAVRLAAPDEPAAAGDTGVLVFRLGDEWLALPVVSLVEVTHPRTPHRVPHRGGLLAGVVNVRGELHLCVRLDRLLGIDPPPAPPARSSPDGAARLVVMRNETERWVFAADAVDQVRRVAAADVAPAPPTLARAAARVTRGVFAHGDRAVGLLDPDLLFAAFRERVR